MLRVSFFFIIVILMIFLIISLFPGKKGPDEYKSFAELEKYEQNHIDYRIRVYKRNPEMAVFAIHGGNIEVGTSEVAEDLGERLDASTYIFEGLKTEGNKILHLTSTLYDEPAAVQMAETSITSLSVHGYRDVKNEKIYMGGRNKEFKKLIADTLTDAGFEVENAPGRLAGTDRKNIVNRGEMGGVQLELSTGLRKSFFKDNDFAMNNRKQQTDNYKEFIKALAKAAKKYKEELK